MGRVVDLAIGTGPRMMTTVQGWGSAYFKCSAVRPVLSAAFLVFNSRWLYAPLWLRLEEQMIRALLNSHTVLFRLLMILFLCSLSVWVISLSAYLKKMSSPCWWSLMVFPFILRPWGACLELFLCWAINWYMILSLALFPSAQGRVSVLPLHLWQAILTALRSANFCFNTWMLWS